MHRTNTRSQTTFEARGSTSVIYDLSHSNTVTITLPAGSTWSSDLHWHETHVEYLCVLKGRIRVILGSTSRSLGPEDGEIEVPVYTVHEWGRDDVQGGSEAVSEHDVVVVRERTVPADGQKEGFFRMLNSFLQEPRPSKMYSRVQWPHPVIERWVEGWVVPIQLFIIFGRFDNFPVVVGTSSGTFSWIATHLCMLLAQAVGVLLGLKSEYPEYLDMKLLNDDSGKRKTT